MSVLNVLEPIYKLLPEVKTPTKKLILKQRLIWTALVLMMFFILGHISLIGLDKTSEAVKQLADIQTILASPLGTVISAGIGPIVLASIILQLLIGAGILNIDLSNSKDKASFTSLQKLFAIILCFVEAAAYTGFGVFPAFLVPKAGMALIVILQIAFGSMILLYLDEVVSKYGIGSGVGLFIAGGVSQTIIVRAFNPLMDQTGIFLGIIPRYFQLLVSGALTGFNFIIPLLPIIFTIIIFFIVVYAEGIHVNIPIALGHKGAGGRFPVKFLYVSNIPVILAAALFANIKIWALLLKDVPIINYLINGIVFVTSSPGNLLGELLGTGIGVFELFGQMIQSIVTLSPIGLGGMVIQAIAYLIILTLACIVFGKLWVEIANQGPEAVANQLQSSGMYIPGFRRDPRITVKILQRYIPPITILGSAFVALLAGFSNLVSALGGGIGILLTVGIVYRLYEELAKEQIMQDSALLARLMK